MTKAFFGVCLFPNDLEAPPFSNLLVIADAPPGTAKGFSIGAQAGIQLCGIGFIVVYTVVLTFVILKIVSLITGGLRVSESDEEQGPDYTAHGETGYTT